MIRVRGLHLSYGARAILRDVDLDIQEGETIALMGPSGGGKTSFAKLLLGLMDANAAPRSTAAGPIWSGQIFIGKDDILKASPRTLRTLRGRTIGLVSQSMSDALNPHMTVIHHMRENLSLHRIRNVSAAEACRRCHIPDQLHHRYPRGLSGGEIQRVLIALALVPEPRCLILDEPTASLDRDNADSVIQMLQDRRGERCQLLITHDRNFASRFADRIVTLHEGELNEGYPRETTLPARMQAPQKYEARSCLSVSHLSHAYEGRPVLKELDFELPEGRCLTITGKSGCGKSTLSRILTGFEAAQAGAVSWKGLQAAEDLSCPAAFAALIPQHPHRALARHFKVFDALKEAIDFASRQSGVRTLSAGADLRARILHLLSTAGLPTDDAFLQRRTGLLSGGEAQRLVISRALAKNTKLLVADEPTSALDEGNKDSILLLLQRLCDEGRALIVMTHDTDVVSRLSGSTMILEGGTFVPPTLADVV